MSGDHEPVALGTGFVGQRGMHRGVAVGVVDAHQLVVAGLGVWAARLESEDGIRGCVRWRGPLHLQAPGRGAVADGSGEAVVLCERRGGFGAG